MSLIKSTYIKTLEEHRRRLARLAEKRGAGTVKKLYDAAQQDLVKKISRSMSPKATFSAQLQRTALAQIKQGQAQLASKLADATADVAKEAQVEAIRGLAATIGRMERIHTGSAVLLPIEEASTISDLIGRRAPMLDKMNKQFYSNYGARVFDSMNEQLSLSMMESEDAGQAIDRIMNVADNEWWQAERIVRTQTAWAYNAGSADAIAEAQDDLPDILQRWTEFVDDDTGKPLDDRVGADSIAMHGQVAAPGEMFIMPSNAVGVSQSMLGESWAFPPNRPNDRSVLSPWRKGWGIPAWSYQDGRRKNLV
jgi:hypothetical protein